MEAKYFNKWEFQQALSKTETNPLEAKLLYEQYLQKYPTNYCTYTYYASLLITLGEFEQAKKIIDFVDIQSKKDICFNKHFNKIKDLERNLFYTKVRFLSYQEKYDELYKFLNDNSKYMDDMNSVSFYCKHKNGKLDPNRRNLNSYLFRQIVRYDEEDFLDHIKKHMADYNEQNNTENSSVFSPGFPIKEVFEEIKKYIPSDKKLMTGFFENVYIFKYDECGRENNKLVNYFKVIAFHNTSSFITMCPSSGCENLPCIDLNYLKPKQENTKVKTSRIARFYQRYNRS